MRRVAIFRQTLLAPSETFVLDQALALERFQPTFIALRRVIPSLPVRADALLTRNTGTPGKLLSAAYRLTGVAPGFHRTIAGLAPALLHAHFAPDGATALSIRSQLGIPLIVTLHGFDVTTQERVISKSLLGRRYLSLRQQLFNDVTSFVCVSQYLRGRAIEKGFPEDKLVVNYTGVDTDRFDRRCDLDASRDSDTILFVGRLVPVKGCEYLIRAVALLGKRGLRPKLVIVGAGPLEADLRELVHKLGVDARFEGRQPPEVVREWLIRSRVFCVPSITTDDGQCEAFGLVFAEAQAMCTPVVSSRSGGIPEAVLDGQTGLLAREKDPDNLALHLERFLTDAEFWSRCARRGREHILRSYSLKQQTDRLETLYERACETGAQHSPLPAAERADRSVARCEP